jgi:protein SCO1/2
VTSQVFVEVRERLGAERDKLNVVSISIDPEQHTPRRLAAYARRSGSDGAWARYTSSRANAIEIQLTFGAWRGDMMNQHRSSGCALSQASPGCATRTPPARNTW